MAMRLAFMGTPEFAVPFLQALHEAGHEIAAVYTQPPRQSGRRGLEEKPSPVHHAAISLGLPVRTPKTLRDAEEQKYFIELNLDTAIVVAYGLLLPEAILNAPRLGCYNAHGSLLPRWRGAAPIQRAIEAGDSETGIVIMRMDKGLDTGPILCAEAADGRKMPFIHRLPIGADMTAGEAFTALAADGAKLMARAVEMLESGDFSLMPQAEEGASYAHKIEKTETRIRWDMPATQAHRHICSLSPAPGAWCEMEFATAGTVKRERVKILASHIPDAEELAAAEKAGLLVLKPDSADKGSKRDIFAPTGKKADFLAVKCGDPDKGSLLFLTKLQKAGGKTLPAKDFLCGAEILGIF